MTVRCSVYLGTSFDGYIAAADGGIEWLLRPEYTGKYDGLSYEDFIATVDALVMGRNSFEKALTFDSWPYAGTPVVVLASREPDIPEALRGNVEWAVGTPQEVVAAQAAVGRKHLYIDGGETVRRFLRAGLIDEITITQLPLLLGQGLSLFAGLGVEVPLRLLAATASDNGFVQVRYAVRSG